MVGLYFARSPSGQRELFYVLRLPDGDGLDIIRAARARDPQVPVIVVTAFASRAARDAALASGASAFLAKPFPASALLRLVHDELERSTP